MKPGLKMGMVLAVALMGADVTLAADNSGTTGTSSPGAASRPSRSEPTIPKGPQHTNMPAARDDLPLNESKTKGATVPQGTPGVSEGRPGAGK